MADGDSAQEAGNGTPPVFISYASQDATAAESIVDALERQGLNCWIAPRDVTAGAPYAGQIIHAIDAAKASVLILSRDAAASPHVLREVERTASKRHAIVALRIDQAPLPADFEYFLNASHWLDASGGDIARTLPKLVAAVRLALQVPATTPAGAPSSRAAAAASTRPPTRIVAMIVVSVIGLGLVGIATERLWLAHRRATPTPVPAFVSPTTAASTAASEIPEQSVAVLPFVDMSEKKDQEYLSDGLSEELIDMLTKVPALHVPARTSSFYFKGKQATVSDIAKALSVSHVLEGSVRKSGNHLRITVQLVRADNGYHLWSESYDRKLDDIFKVQDEIARAVVKALKVSLLQGTASRPIPTSSTEAYTLYLRARAVALRAGQGDYRTAVRLLRRALVLDPRFAAAWAEVANDVIDDFDWNASRPVEDARAEALEAATKALELDPNLSDGHLAKAKILHWMDWNWDAAEAEFRRTLVLAPANAEALRANAYLAQTIALSDRQLELAQKAVAADPLDSWNYFAVGLAQTLGGRTADAVVTFRKALELNPTGVGLQSTLGRALVVLGDPAAGLVEIAREDDDFQRLMFRPYALEALGRKVEADADIAATERDYGAKRPGVLGRWYECHRDFDRASLWFDRAYRQRDTSLLWADWCRRSLLSDPRYLALRRQVGLPE